MSSPGKPRRRPIGRRVDAMQDRIDAAALRLEAAKARQAANRPPHGKAWLGIALIWSGIALAHFGHPWWALPLTLVGIYQCVVYFAIKYAHLHPDYQLTPAEITAGQFVLTHTGPDAYRLDLADATTYTITRHSARLWILTGTSPAGEGARYGFPTLDAAITALTGPPTGDPGTR